jgi:hypothetical protein
MLPWTFEYIAEAIQLSNHISYVEKLIFKCLCWHGHETELCQKEEVDKLGCYFLLKSRTCFLEAQTCGMFQYQTAPLSDMFVSANNEWMNDTITMLSVGVCTTGAGT